MVRKTDSARAVLQDLRPERKLGWSAGPHERTRPLPRSKSASRDANGSNDSYHVVTLVPAVKHLLCLEALALEPQRTRILGDSADNLIRDACWHVRLNLKRNSYVRTDKTS